MLETIRETVSFIRNKANFEPEIAIILGTGLGGVVDDIDIKSEINYADIPNFPVSTAPGHKGKLIFGLLGGKKVMALQGRFHFYEGYTMEELSFPIRVLKYLDIKYLFISNASGGTPDRSVLSDRIIEITGKSNRKWIGIAPFAQYESKMYPLNLMDKVIETLSKTYHILLFGGGKKEIEILSTLERQHSNVTNLAGKLSLGEELDVISNLDLMLSMDSGNAHLAAMLGINVITIWGVTHPFAGFYPFDQDMENALLADRSRYPKIPTSIYGNKYPENYRQASQTVSPEIIVEKINSI